MSTDTLAVIGSGLGGLLTLGIAMFAGFAWIIRRMDALEARLILRIDGGDQKLDSRITRLDSRITRLDSRIDELDSRMERRMGELERRMDTRFDAVERELTEVKIAVARIEGPRPHLVVAR